MVLISVLITVVLVLGIGYFAPYLPGNELIYQIGAVALALVVSAYLNKPMFNMLRGNSAYKKGRYKEALEKYKKAYKTKRLSVDMEIFCGYIFLKEGDKALCQEVFERVSKRKLTERQKNSLDTNKALLLWKQDKLDEAIELLWDVWNRANSVTVAGSLGALMLIKAKSTGDYDSVIEFCEQTNEQYTYERTILANLGEAYYCTGENQMALETFKELMDCGSSAPAAYYYYALALLKEGKREKAEDMLNRSLKQRFSSLSTVSRKTVKSKLDEITEE